MGSLRCSPNCSTRALRSPSDSRNESVDSETSPPLNVAVGGPQGVGKSTVLRLLRDQWPAVEVVSIGDQLPPDFKQLSATDRARARLQAGNVVLDRMTRQAGGVLLVDLHYLDMDEVDPRIQSSKFLERFSHHVLLIASPAAIESRRRSDTQRSNRSFDYRKIQRDVEAHTEYFRLAMFPRSTVIDCERPPEAIAAAIVAFVGVR